MTATNHEPPVIFTSTDNKGSNDGSQLTTSSLYKSFLAGTSGGVCSAILFQPLDVLKTRMQSSINKGQGAAGLGRTFVDIVRHERVLTLWNGLIPSLTRTVPGMGIYFTTIHILTSKFSHNSQPNLVHSLATGATARVVAVGIMLPFTVIKTRYECGEFNYRNMRSGLKYIYHTEGFKGLYSGLWATVLRDAPFSALYYAFYTQFKAFAKREIQTDYLSPPVHFLCGLCAGLLASATTQPADVIKTHIQMYPHKFTKVKHAVAHIITNDGWSGFFRGLSARMIRRTLVAALAWTVYEKMMQLTGEKT